MSTKLPTEFVPAFQRYIYRFYDAYGRHDLPWRQNYDPYRIMVSEIMLQQTQVDRVIPKFMNFLNHFPTVETLAKAPQSEVVKAWQGLGYNRRGLNLQHAAQTITTTFDSQFPQTTEELLSLPGIGPYTASAIQAFAFNQPSMVIETNIRTLFIFHFFHEAYNVGDQELITLIETTLDRENPRKWYSALMDYGSYLKTVVGNPTRKSKTYLKQSKLAGSNRQARGLILKVLTQHTQLSFDEMITHTNLNPERLGPAIHQLVKEDFIEFEAEMYRLKN